jgi:DNA-binding SARP family transcriptional activator
VSESQAPLTFLVAPGGYGKTLYLKQQAEAFQGAVFWLDALRLPANTDFWQVLRAQAEVAGLPLDEFSGQATDQATDQITSQTAPQNWPAAWSKQAVLFLLDDWHVLEQNRPLADLVARLLSELPAQMSVSLSTRRRPDQLPLAALCAAGKGHYLDAEALAWTDLYLAEQAQALGLKPETADFQSLAGYQGWPLGCALYLRQRQGELTESAFATLLNQAIDQVFADVAEDWQTLIDPAREAELRAWQLAPDQWLPLWRKRLFSHFLLSAQHWLMRALQPENSPLQSQVLLERGLALCKPAEAPLRLSILTRLAHFASLEARWEDLDKALAEAEPLLEVGYAVDRAAWYYQKANRARQCCRYAEAEQYLQALFGLRADSKAALNLQARGHILRGLSAYQQGDYALTRRSYEQAQILAEADKNTQMLLELSIMLAFLDALQGDEVNLPEDILSQVAEQSLAAQPMMWLNLTFLRILGEHLDLKLGKDILERVRDTSRQLNWHFMVPLIADVEARLWRFHQAYDSARKLHEEALQQLAENTFEHLHASLNLALTCSRQGDSEQAIALLREVLLRAESSGSFSLLREARAALQALVPAEPLTPTPALERPRSPAPVLGAGSTGKPLKISLLGGFQLEVQGETVSHWPRKKARHILVHLLFHPHGLHRESLADWLSGSDELEQALRQLDVHIHSLRKVLEPERKGKQASEYIHFHDACYSFNWHCEYVWDVELFNSAYQQWLKLKDSAVEQAYSAANEALTLYKGAFLPELDFADYWLAEREGLERRMGDLIQWCIPYLCQQQQPEQAEELANRLLSQDACSESGFAALLEIAAMRKSLSRLKKIQAQMEETFEREWGMSPPAELEILYQKLEKSLT